MSAHEMDGLERAKLRFQIGMCEEALQDDEPSIEVLQFLAQAYTLVGRYEDGLRADRRLVDLCPEDAGVHYNLACSLALTGAREAAFDALGHAVDVGFEDAELLTSDDDLCSLRADPRFEAIVRRVARGPRGEGS